MRRQDFTKSTFGALVCSAIVAGAWLAAPSLTGASTASAQQNITIAPTRVVFEERDRTEELVLVNRGNEAVTYRISIINKRMTEEGSLERIEEPDDGQNFAEDLLRFAPRQVHIEPGDSQRVRVSVRKPQELEDGEYRSHMLFQAVPDAGDDDADIELDEDDGELALRLNIISGISIPAIVRHGELSVDVGVEDLEFVEAEGEGPDQLRFRLARDGNQSVYGNLQAQFVPNEADEEGEDPEPVTISRRGGTAVYTPNEGRNVEMLVNPPDDISLDDGRILVTYESDDTGETLASGEIELE